MTLMEDVHQNQKFPSAPLGITALSAPGTSCEGNWTKEHEAVPVWDTGAIEPLRLRSSGIAAMEPGS